MTVFEKRKNYGLCDLSFTEKPYCNQTGALLNPNHRFCDVCGKSWLIQDGLIIETTRTVYKAEEVLEGSKWFRQPNTTVTVVSVEDDYVEYMPKGGSLTKASIRAFQSAFRPIVSTLS